MARSMKGPSQRCLRVGEEVRHILSDLLARRELPMEALQGQSITVTEVRMSADLRQANVYVIPLGGKGGAEAVKALQAIAPKMRHFLAKQMSMKAVPHLRFHYDATFDEVDRVDALLRDM